MLSVHIGTDDIFPVCVPALAKFVRSHGGIPWQWLNGSR
jgi:hypothetical protein